MTKNIINYIGVDVSKNTLDCSQPSTQPEEFLSKTFPNSATGISALIKWLPQAPHIVVEATGGYQDRLVETCLKKSIAVSVANPARVRSFARSKGILAKTDKIDAQTILDFASVFQPKPLAKVHEDKIRLAYLLDMRTTFVNDRTAHKNRLQQCSHSEERSHFSSIIKTLDSQIAKIEKKIDALIKSNPLLNGLSSRLIATPGVGKIVAASIIAYLPEIGTCNRREIAAIAGLAPYANDSGQKNGRRSIFGGRHKIRRLLYLAAVSITSSNKSPLYAQYNSFKTKGKPGKVSIVAIARKLLVHSNSLCKNFLQSFHELQ